jgi:hypothetical protein
LLVPGDVVGDGQLVDVVEFKDFFELQRNYGQRIGVVALAGVEYARDAADVAQL